MWFFNVLNVGAFRSRVSKAGSVNRQLMPLFLLYEKPITNQSQTLIVEKNELVSIMHLYADVNWRGNHDDLSIKKALEKSCHRV